MTQARRRLPHDEVVEDERLGGQGRVPESARLATLPKLGFTWSGVLLSSTPIIAGIVVTQKQPTAGYPIGLIGMILGLMVGASAVGWLSTWGPRTGLGQMPLNRLAFGRTNLVPEAILAFTLISWSTLNLLFGVSAITEVLGLPFTLGLAIVGGTQLLIGLLGYRAFERLGLVVTLLMSVVIIALAVGAARETPPMAMLTPQGAMTLDGFTLGFAFGLGATFAWTIQATDTSRNLPADTSRRRLFWTVWSSMVIPLSVLGFLGAWVGTAMAVNSPMERLDQVLGGGLIAAFGLLSMGLSLAAENSYNDYSNVIILRSWGARWSRRTLSLICTASAISLALVLQADPLGDLEETGEVVLGYFCAPVFGVMLVELILRRRRRDPTSESAVAPGAAIIAFLVGYVTLFAFTQTTFGDAVARDVPGLAWVGSAPRLVLHGVEGGYVAGTLIAAVVYAILRPLGKRGRQPSSYVVLP